MLIAAGVAASTAVIFNAPLSGVVFAAEILLTQISLFAILLIVTSTILATGTEYLLNGINPIFSSQTVNQINEHLTFFNAFIFVFFAISAMLGSTTGALLTSIILVSEMMRGYQFVLPLLMTVLTAYSVRHYLCSESIYTLKSYRRGIILHYRYYK
jgi:H+/Cl- antiporter ClcA